MARLKQNSGFTLVEVIIGMTLSLMVMGALLSSYVFISKNFSKSLGIGSATDPNLEGQGRRALTYFARDVRMASGITGTISSTEVTLQLPTGAGIKDVTYYFNDGTGPISIYGVTLEKDTLTRIDRDTNTATTLHTNLLQLPAPQFEYYDAAGNPYTAATLLSGNYLSGIKQMSMAFSSQVGRSENGTLSGVYQIVSPRLILRNKGVLP